jgi:hypothetical protein
MDTSSVQSLPKVVTYSRAGLPVYRCGVVGHKNFFIHLCYLTYKHHSMLYHYIKSILGLGTDVTLLGQRQVHDYNRHSKVSVLCTAAPCIPFGFQA